MCCAMLEHRRLLPFAFPRQVIPFTNIWQLRWFSYLNTWALYVCLEFGHDQPLANVICYSETINVYVLTAMVNFSGKNSQALWMYYLRAVTGTIHVIDGICERRRKNSWLNKVESW